MILYNYYCPGKNQMFRQFHIQWWMNGYCYHLPGRCKAEIDHCRGAHYTCHTYVIHLSPWGEGGSSWNIIPKTYHLIAELFIGAPLQINFHEVVICWSLKSIRRNTGEGLVHHPPNLEYGFLFIGFSRFFCGQVWWNSSSKFSMFIKNCRPLPAQNPPDPTSPPPRPICCR